MKMHKMMSKVLSFVLVIMLLTSALPLTAFASEQTELSYSFANDKAGFAEGKITLTLKSTGDYGSYDLYWANDNGVLSGYYPITSLSAVNGTASFSFLQNIAIPPDATKLMAYRTDTESDRLSVENADFVYDIPKAKQNPNRSDDKTLSFEALSDTQLDQQTNVFYKYSQRNFAMALENAANRNVDFITTSGDCINNYENGTSKEWQGFQKVIADSSFTNPIYETNGNHSMKSDHNYGLEAYKAATGLGVDDEALGDEPYYEVTAKNGDHFLFVALEDSHSVGDSDEFTIEQMNWLESTIQKYYADGHKIFVFEHAFFHGWGPGDDKDEHYYIGGLRTSSDFPNNRRFKNILDKYNEVFCYTGHSHFDFMYNWNYDNENGRACNLFHVPATACTTHITNGKIDYSMDERSSQCYIVDCYDDMVISNGLNVVDNLIYPQYTYIVDTSGYTHEPQTDPSGDTTQPTTESTKMIDVQVNNTTSYLYSEGAAVFFYNNASGNHFPVDSETGIASIPENATNLTLYRCKGSWNSGAEAKSDSATSYWNKFGPVERAAGQNIFNVAGSSKFSWSSGQIIYPQPETTSPTEPATDPSTEPFEAVEIKVLDATSNLWVFAKGAAVFLYDKDTGEHYAVTDGKAYVPTTAVNFTVYRCDGGWNAGNKGDDITNYWNKWDISTRTGNFDIINITGSGKYTWLSSLSYKPEENVNYYLIGYFNGIDYNSRDYRFDADGKLSMEFTDDSYVYVVSSSNTSYWTNGWLGLNQRSATLCRETSVPNPDKLFVPSGKADFTLTVNDDGTLTISYEYEPNELDKTEIEPIFDNLTLGDVNNDGKVNIIDVTLIQKYAVKKIDFSAEKFYCADVTGKGSVTVNSAATVQKHIAQLIEKFPAEAGYKPDVSTLEKLLEAAKETLYTDYRYASYVAYSKLKTQYYAYKDADISKMSDEQKDWAYDDLGSAFTNYNNMKAKNNVVTVYFCNDIGWPTVNAYCYNSASGKSINSFDNAQGISKVKSLKSGVKIYEITLNKDKWDKIIFTNGDGSQTVSLDVPDRNYIGFYFTDCKTSSIGRLIPNKFRYTYDRI